MDEHFLVDAVSATIRRGSRVAEDVLFLSPFPRRPCFRVGEARVLRGNDEFDFVNGYNNSMRYRAIQVRERSGQVVRQGTFSQQQLCEAPTRD